ncbi:uncharacterized protein LOC108600373 [Drosophila busckii]|uniref:uncharacterized protein LOC108600373 n=1 Tax=Drosophila busckii TaxID=30019 RepID=UPI0014330949|nr:uncharacterized protein LOC108600373 [Drosophila busckii]
MLAHRHAALTPRLQGASNYKEWRQKIELQLRIRHWWSAVLSTPKPVEQSFENVGAVLFVASPKRIYLQTSPTMDRKVRRFLCHYINPDILPDKFFEKSVPAIWFELRCKYSNRKCKRLKQAAAKI